MKQLLNVFRKDVRSRWLELLLVLICLIAYAHYEIGTWPGERASGFSGIGGLFLISTLSQLTTLLLPLSWLLLIARVVQDESLVGDRQFWVTRPYDRKKLLLSKLLFIVIFINVPLLCLQMYLLYRAGFSLSTYFLSLVPTHLALLLAIVLPALTLAAVTASLGQYFLAIIAVILSLIGISFLHDKIPNSSFSGPSETLELLTWLGVLIAAVVIQYLVRRTSLSRLLLVGCVVMIAVVVVIFPYTLVIKSEYPLRATSQPQLTWTLNPPESSRVAYNDDQDEVEYQLPLTVNGLSEAQVVAVDGYKVRFESSDGSRWESSWKSTYSKLYSRRSNSIVDVRIKRFLAERYSKNPTNVRMSLLLTRYRTENLRTFIVPAGEFRLPELGICAGASGYSSSLRCRIPVTARQSVVLTTDLSKSTCPVPKNQNVPPEGTVAFDWMLNDSEFDPALSSVRAYYVTFWDFDLSRKGMFEPGVCAGTPLVFQDPVAERQEQVQFSVDGVDLKAYEAQPFRLSR